MFDGYATSGLRIAITASELYRVDSIFLIVFFLSQISVAGIHQDKCQAFDYSDRFGPIRDQDGHGYCFAFSAAALIEERLCKEDPKKCGKSISPLDASRCNWNLNLSSEKEGGDAKDALNCAVDNGGVCWEEDAPYNALTDMGCSLWDIFSHEGALCKNKKIVGLYTRWQHTCANFNDNTTNLNAIAEVQKALVKSLKEKVPEELLTGKYISSIFYESTSESDFLKNVLISKSCENNRMQVKAKIVHVESEHKTAIEKDVLVNYVAKGLRGNSSVAISLDLGRTGWHQYKEKSNHSLIVTGMRFNDWTKKCEFKLRNSHGEGANFNGWYPVEDIERAITRVRYLGDD